MEKMKENNILEVLTKKSQDAIFYSELKDAGEVIKDINFELEKLQDEFGANNTESEEYLKILSRLKMLRMALITDEDVTELFSNHTVEMFNDPDMDLFDRVEARQLVYSEFLRFEEVNKRIIEAMHLDEEEIGDAKIFVEGIPEAVPPTVHNWLADYDRTYGTEPQSDLVWLNYVTRGKNSARLNEESRELLRKLIKLYEYLKRENTSELETENEK